MSFTKGGGIRPPFGKNQYRRSTHDGLFESGTIAKDSVIAETIDGVDMKIMQSGEVIAKITSGPNVGKYGPFQAVGVSEVQTATKTGTWTSGTYDVTVKGVLVEDVPMATTASALQTLLEAAGLPSGSVVITGGPVNTTPLVFTFHSTTGGNEAAVVFDTTNIVGGGTVGVVETAGGTTGATDGRGSTANIVGVLETFLPWELNERDHNASYMYDGTVNQAWCFERNAAGLRIALTNTTRDAIIALPTVKINFK